jgi:hypothetical protein
VALFSMLFQILKHSQLALFWMLITKGVAMKPKSKRILKYILWSLLLIISISILWIIRPCSSYDKSKIDKRLTSLEEPFKSVRTCSNIDGGSVGIKIVNKNDIALKIALSGMDKDSELDSSCEAMGVQTEIIEPIKHPEITETIELFKH